MDALTIAAIGFAGGMVGGAAFWILLCAVALSKWAGSPHG